MQLPIPLFSCRQLDLEAFRLFACPKIDRPNLQGVRVEVTASVVRFIATDACALLAGPVETREQTSIAAPVAFTIPSDLIDLLPEAHYETWITVAFDGTHIVLADQFIGKPLVGFPNWRVVLPDFSQENPVPLPVFDAEKLAVFAEAFRLLGKHSVIHLRATFPGSSIRVICGPLPDTIGLLMPCRGVDVVSAPTWPAEPFQA